MCYNCLYLLSLISTLLSYIEGCGRTPATPAPTTPPPITTSGPETHRRQCTANETTSQACLNGGECFVLEYPERKTYCLCPLEYAGQRCEYLDPGIIFQQEREQQIATAGIAASAVAATLFVTVLVLIAVYHRKYKRRKMIEKARQNGAARASEENDETQRLSINITANPNSDSDNYSISKDPYYYHSNGNECIGQNGSLIDGETRV